MEILLHPLSDGDTPASDSLMQSVSCIRQSDRESPCTRQSDAETLLHQTSGWRDSLHQTVGSECLSASDSRMQESLLNQTVWMQESLCIRQSDSRSLSASDSRMQRVSCIRQSDAGYSLSTAGCMELLLHQTV